MIADDHPIVLFGLRKSPEQIEWVNVVGEFEDSTALINALTFWLCDRMTRKLGGQMTIKARESLGTRYTLHLKMPASEEAPEAGEHLLDDVIVHAR